VGQLVCKQGHASTLSSDSSRIGPSVCPRPKKRNDFDCGAWGFFLITPRLLDVPGRAGTELFTGLIGLDYQKLDLREMVGHGLSAFKLVRTTASQGGSQQLMIVSEVLTRPLCGRYPTLHVPFVPLPSPPPTGDPTGGDRSGAARVRGRCPPAP
jgi:hypothetical protein